MLRRVNQMPKKPNPNPFADRGREQFASVLAELDAKRELIAARTGKSPEEVKFKIRGSSNNLIPVVIAASNPNPEPIAAVKTDFSSPKGLSTIQDKKQGHFAAEKNVYTSIPSSGSFNSAIIFVMATLLLSGAEIGLIWLWRTIYAALISLLPLFFLLTLTRMTNSSVSDAISTSSSTISSKQGISEIRKSVDGKQRQIKQEHGGQDEGKNRGNGNVQGLRRNPYTGTPVWAILSLVLAVLTIGRIPAILITTLAWYIYPVIQPLIADFLTKTC